MQPARTAVMYSPGRWKVYSCSLLASSNTTAPASIDWAARQIAAAMSKTCVRMLTAGTVNPPTSPRPRAAYRSWMLHDGAPSSCDACQMIQRAASTASRSSEKVAVHTAVRTPSSRNRLSSTTRRTPSSTRQLSASALKRALTEVAGVGYAIAASWPSNRTGMVRAERVAAV